MKLYNLYEEVIIESKGLLTESNFEWDIKKVIDDKYNVRILYQDDPNETPTLRYLQVYTLGVSKAGNKVIRAYQLGFESKKSKIVKKWKLFRVDKIVGWSPTRWKWWNPISDYKSDIPTYRLYNDKSMNSVIKKVDSNKFNRLRSDISQKPEQNYNDINNNEDGNTQTSKP